MESDYENNLLVDMFRQCVMRGKAIDDDAPKLLKRILRDGLWKRLDKNGKPFTHVEQFIVAKPPPGLGSTVKMVEQIIAHDIDAVDAFRQALQATERKGGRPPSLPKPFDNIQELTQAPTGTSRQSALRRLVKDRPDLHAKVLAKELSPNAAMVEAGFRDKPITIPSDPVKAARRIRRHFAGERLAKLIEELTR
jgi:hypothetical protein